MSRIFITGSADGLGRFAAGALTGDGHEVVLHARTPRAGIGAQRPRAGRGGSRDRRPSSAAQTRDLAGQVNAIGRMDAVIHNAGVYRAFSLGDRRRSRDDACRERLRPLTRLPLDQCRDRLIDLSSGLHRAGAGFLWRSTGPGGAGTPGRRTPRASSTSPRSRSPPRARGRKGLQRRRSGLGPDQDGRRWGNRRPGAGVSHADLAGPQQRRGRDRGGLTLVSRACRRIARLPQ